MPSRTRTIPLPRAFSKRAAFCWEDDLRTTRLRTESFWIHFLASDESKGVTGKRFQAQEDWKAEISHDGDKGHEESDN
jgi:hypothetical protein